MPAASGGRCDHVVDVVGGESLEGQSADAWCPPGRVRRAAAGSGQVAIRRPRVVGARQCRAAGDLMVRNDVRSARGSGRQRAFAASWRVWGGDLAARVCLIGGFLRGCGSGLAGVQQAEPRSGTCRGRDPCQQPMQGGLIRQQTGKECLRTFALKVDAPEPVSPAVVKGAFDADLIRGRSAPGRSRLFAPVREVGSLAWRVLQPLEHAHEDSSGVAYLVSPRGYEGPLAWASPEGAIRVESPSAVPDAAAPP